MLMLSIWESFCGYAGAFSKDGLADAGHDDYDGLLVLLHDLSMGSKVLR